MDKKSLLESLTSDQLGGGDEAANPSDGGGGEQQGDLFGDIDDDEGPPLVSSPPEPQQQPPPPPARQPPSVAGPVGASLPPDLTGTAANTIAPSSAAPTPPPVLPSINGTTAVQPPASVPAVAPAAESLLSKSGLLGMAGSEAGVDADGDGGGGGLFDDVDEEEKKQTEEAAARAKAAEEMAQRQQQQEAEAAAAAEAARKQQEQQQQQAMLQQQQQQQQMYHQPQQQPPFNNGQPQPQVMTGGYMQQQQHLQPPQMNPGMGGVPGTPQQQLAGQIQNMSLNSNGGGGVAAGGGFYREHQEHAPVPPNQVPGVVSYPTSGPGGPGMPQQQNSYYYGTQQQHQGQPSAVGQPGFTQPSTTAGMHNAAPNLNLGRVRNITLVKPQDVAPLYTDIKVSEPMLIQNQSFLINSPPYWSYQLTSVLANNQGTWLVRRRFRHVVALEDRLRHECPGSILPPRPEKHATRAIEEASTQQSAEFAMQRAKELERYLNNVAKHPVAGHSQALRLFLGLQDDIGTAWAEVSTNAFTRLGAVGAGVSMKVAENTTNLTAASSPAHEWEEDAELLSLTNSEYLRLGAVSQAVPKLEGLIMVLRDQGDGAGALGMEMSKASKTLDADFKVFEILSNGLLRHGRRTKRLSLELSAAADSFLQQYRLVRYEKMAMNDRRHAIQKKAKERGRADARAYQLHQQQQHFQYNNGQMNHLSHLQQSAIGMDGQALNAVSEADEIGARLKSEIHRVAITRRIGWNNSVKTIASSMKEACAERAAIWEATLESFENFLKATGPGV
mmetsp:Transcript_31613/g.76723  ORF Transcript_31613/g.76723 Transcript_31613/m.76723 type:complete len:784 (+) Transcript_31613:166-2517(+)